MKRTPLLRRTPLKRGGKPLALSRLNPVSKDPRKRRENAAYEKAVREWWAGHDGRCEMRFICEETKHRARYAPNDGIYTFPGRCSNAAEPRPHHMKRRGRFLCDKSTFIGLCRSCHIDWLHNNEEEARRLGYLLDRPAKSSNR